MTHKKTSPPDKEKSKDVPAVNNHDLAKREFTQEEKERLARHEQRASRKSVKCKVIMGKKNKPSITYKDPDDPLLRVKLSEAFGTADIGVQVHLLDQIAQVFNGACSADGNNNEVAVTAMNTAMAILAGIQPQNEVEAMLAVQMIGVHNMAMRTMGLAMLGGQTLQGKESNGNLATKMLRTFIAQMETLQKIRTGGQQKMIVEHVHVNEGGQAIVGTVNQGGAKNDRNHE